MVDGSCGAPRGRGVAGGRGRSVRAAEEEGGGGRSRPRTEESLSRVGRERAAYRRHASGRKRLSFSCCRDSA